jgi:hypothetical protein
MCSPRGGSDGWGIPAKGIYFPKLPGVIRNADLAEKQFRTLRLGIERLEDATVVFCFSGHGNESGLSLGGSAHISWDDLASELLNQFSKKKRVVIILEACYSGRIIPALQKKVRNTNVITWEELQADWCILTTAHEDEVSWDNPFTGGVATNGLIKAFKSGVSLYEDYGDPEP